MRTSKEIPGMTRSRARRGQDVHARLDLPRAIRVSRVVPRRQWTQTTDGLAVTLPERKPCDFAYFLKIEKGA